MHFFQKDFEEYFGNFKINEKFLGIKNYASVKSANIEKIAKLMKACSERVRERERDDESTKFKTSWPWKLPV